MPISRVIFRRVAPRTAVRTTTRVVATSAAAGALVLSATACGSDRSAGPDARSSETTSLSSSGSSAASSEASSSAAPPTGSGPSASSPSTSVPSGRTPTARVTLGPQYSTRTVRLRVGQELRIEVATSVQARLDQPNGPVCTPGQDGPSQVLTVLCGAPPTLRYLARAPGREALGAEVRPKCLPGAMCPRWITHPELMVIVT